MAIQSILVEDSSPLIQYAPEGAWLDTSSEDDTMAALYSGGSYHLSYSRNATATFKFRGTGFTILGGRRPGYGPFALSLDGRQLYEGNPVPGASPIKNSLAVVTSLPYGDHTLVFTNSGEAPVDIDSITFEAKIGPTDGQSNMTTIDDTDHRISYRPMGAWNTNAGPEYKNGTFHYSQAANASASVQFSGNAVALYGTASPDHADISVTIDGRGVTMSPRSGRGVNAVRRPVLLYFADSLSDGQHTMVVSKGPNSNTTFYIDIDSFVVYSSGASSRSSDTATIKPSRTTVIAVATVAGVIVLLLFILGAFLIFRKRHQRRRLSMNESVKSPVTPALPMQYPGLVFPPPAPLAQMRQSYLGQRRASNLSVAPSYYDDPYCLEGRESFDRRRTASIASSERSILPTSRFAMPEITEVPVTHPLRPPRPPF